MFGTGSGGAEGGSSFEFGQRERLPVFLQRVLLQVADGGGGERTRDALIRVFTWNRDTTSDTEEWIIPPFPQSRRFFPQNDFICLVHTRFEFFVHLK